MADGVSQELNPSCGLKPSIAWGIRVLRLPLDHISIGFDHVLYIFPLVKYRQERR
jgi:hypothetical protein